ncbi:carbohydrate ABC transporter permease [Bifidobacterium oedipodis]|uniref:L-arabinose transport system permease protein AraQ n=1 Tax=Bifidobacterium oedipodis TaxID=2675322 RepID=A0A7Y0EQ77_9BIFI|nr:carbohydrate ABC transporter permease [Bifidobacterium sp. DSM 109957]NMM94433.1 L-arabinose transport system permease protein AraQ [Bifidobacterium sp. DSM 109957]
MSATTVSSKAIRASKKKDKKVKEKFTLGEGVCMLVTAVLFCIVAFPVFYAFLQSFRTYAEITIDPMGMPTVWHWENYVRLFQDTDFLGATFNTLFITVISLAILIIILPMAAYGVERIGGKASGFLYLLFLSGLMIPFQVRMIPLVRMFNAIGIYGDLWAVILVHLGGAAGFGILLYCSFLKGVPVSLEEAASLDGAGRLRIFWQIVFPMLMPVTSAFVITNALSFWNDFFIPLVMLDASSAGTINVAINRMVGLLTSQWELIYAGAIISLIPSLIIFAAFQRYFIKGMAVGAVKG